MTEEIKKVSFDEWYMMREKQIPMIHYREILKADFGGQGLSSMETVERFDAALLRYGVKI